MGTHTSNIDMRNIFMIQFQRTLSLNKKYRYILSVMRASISLYSDSFHEILFPVTAWDGVTERSKRLSKK